MTREEAIKILDEVIPPPEHHTVDLDHLRIAQAWLCIKETLTVEKHGEWKKAGDNFWDCSECGQRIFSMSKQDREEFHKWCGRCGAKMDERSKDV